MTNMGSDSNSSPSSPSSSNQMEIDSDSNDLDSSNPSPVSSSGIDTMPESEGGLSASSAPSSDNEDGEAYPMPVSKDDPEYDFEVEKILACDVDFDGVIRFFVKWKGYPNSDNTSESINQLEGCFNMLKKTLLQKGGTASFRINANVEEARKFDQAHYAALLLGSQNVKDYKESWPQVDKSKSLQVLGNVRVSDEDEAEYIVRFDSMDMACVSEKDLEAAYGGLARLAIVKYLERKSLPY